MKFRIALLSATVLAAPFALSHIARAQPVTGVYVSAGGGYNNQEKIKLKDFIVNNVGEPGTARVSFLGGYTGETSIGYGFGNGLRIELEGDYYNNRYKTITFAGAQFKGGGYEQKYGGFINAIYDLDIGLPFLYPYIGGGLGYQVVNATDQTIGPITVSQPKGSFAYQGIAGVSVPIRQW